MPSVQNTIKLPEPPSRVWFALTRTDQRDLWGPVFRLERPATGEVGTVYFRLPGIPGEHGTDAIVDNFSQPQRFSWWCGLAKVFRLSEAYDLTGNEGGTTLMHTMTIDGPLSFIAPLVLRRWRALMIASDRRLERHLKNSTVARLSQGRGRTPTRARKGFR